jgi:hypothetical protein
MLSSSPSKIHEPLVTGVSPRPTDRRQRQELRNTSGRVGAENLSRASTSTFTASRRRDYGPQALAA